MTRRPSPTASARRATKRLLACTAAALALAAVAAGEAPAAIPAAPGGPILVVTSNGDSFGSYLPEILRGEGLNEFDVADIGSVDPRPWPPTTSWSSVTCRCPTRRSRC